MDLPLEHLRTLAAIIDEGSLERAAAMLNVSPSAVSQRIRTLEERTGAVLLNRTRPVSVTETGATVLRAARQVARVIDDAASELSPDATSGSRVKLVINADSLATWFVPALARAARETGAWFEVLRSDQAQSTEKLRSGEVMAALTSTAEAVPGCVSELVGVDRYHAVCSPAFYEAHFAGGGTGGPMGGAKIGVTPEALAEAPHIDFDRSDHLQERFLSAHGCENSAPSRHFVPSSAEFATAIELGMGWGMLPWRQCEAPLARGTLVELAPHRPLELPLFWQRWNLRSPVLDELSRIITEEAKRALFYPSTE